MNTLPTALARLRACDALRGAIEREQCSPNRLDDLATRLTDDRARVIGSLRRLADQLAALPPERSIEPLAFLVPCVDDLAMLAVRVLNRDAM